MDPNEQPPDVRVPVLVRHRLTTFWVLLCPARPAAALQHCTRTKASARLWTWSAAGPALLQGRGLSPGSAKGMVATLITLSMSELRGNQVTDEVPASLLSARSLSAGAVQHDEAKGRRMYHRNKDVQYR